jgi:cell division protein FtsB
MRWITPVITVLLVLIQYPLWLGEGGWLKVWEREKKLAIQQKTNEELRARNTAMEGEVRDLRTGTAAIEERARYELGMIKNDEIFVRVVEKSNPAVQ